MAAQKIAGGYVKGLQSMDHCLKLGVLCGDKTEWLEIHANPRGRYVKKYMPKLHKVKKFYLDGTLLLAVTALREHFYGR